MGKVPMTKAGFEKILAEHEHLNKVELVDIIEKVAEARANGDLKENAEYHAAREKQGHIQDRIKYLEEQIANAQVIETNNNSESIVFGSQVTTVDPDDEDDEDEYEIFTLVGQDEADPAEDMISVNSPLGKALLGKKAGDIIQVPAPAGSYELKIVDFK
jgi:transcription elongation factor GreA